MAEILDLQDGEQETPREEKASNISLRWCRNSYISVALCFVKQ
ncbi:SapB/AmfS family lantipeptide [Propioniciclava coleopterorum]|uniref:SapB/AmfS family lantipeptide n=1 Tax=Propioniciclava coleopterorum TaxID=2714937 RepID=A0A6G7Y698_9ACTN|nr:SapB/AmfS family lanthipeptide [Propioniciclava coleopterorum]QIK72335.1 SapB/AmfS family lantipeptide [Propioniciclava coleopterorum]